MTWSSANNSVDSCWFFDSLIPFMSCLCHLVIISSKYTLNSAAGRGQLWGTALLFCTGFVILWLNCINISFVCVNMHCIVITVSGICLQLNMLNKICLCLLSNVFSQSINYKCISQLNSLPFSITNLRKNVGSVHDRP